MNSLVRCTRAGGHIESEEDRIYINKDHISAIYRQRGEQGKTVVFMSNGMKHEIEETPLWFRRFYQ